MKALLFLILLGAAIAGAQTLDSNTITVTASRTSSVPTEQVQYTVTATFTKLDATATQSALAKAGITGLTLGGSGGVNGWSFTGTVSYAKVNDLLKSLAAAAASLRPDTSLTWIVGTSTVTDATAFDVQRKLLPDLMADARKRAAALADAAGITVGNLLAVADTSLSTGPSSSNSLVSMNVDVTASITVKFAALRYN